MDLFDLIRLALVFFFIIIPISKSLRKKGVKGKTKPQASKPTRTLTGSKATMDDFNARVEKARKRVQQAMGDVDSQHSPSHTSSQHVGTEAADELFHGTNKTQHIEMPDGFSQPIITSKHANMPQGLGRQSQVPKGLSGQMVVKHQNLPTGMSGRLSKANHQDLPTGLTGHLSNKYYRPQFETGIDRLETHQSEHVKFKQHTATLSRKARKHIKLKDSLIQTDGESIVNGIIWHQILSEPRFKNSWRK